MLSYAFCFLNYGNNSWRKDETKTLKEQNRKHALQKPRVSDLKRTEKRISSGNSMHSYIQ